MLVSSPWRVLCARLWRACSAADPAVVFTVGTVPGEGPSEDSGHQCPFCGRAETKDQMTKENLVSCGRFGRSMTTQVSESHGCELDHMMTRVLTEPFPSCMKQGKHEFKFKMLSNQTRHMAAVFKLINYPPHFPIKSSI